MHTSKEFNEVIIPAFKKLVAVTEFYHMCGVYHLNIKNNTPAPYHKEVIKLINKFGLWNDFLYFDYIGEEETIQIAFNYKPEATK